MNESAALQLQITASQRLTAQRTRSPSQTLVPPNNLSLILIRCCNTKRCYFNAQESSSNSPVSTWRSAKTNIPKAQTHFSALWCFHEISQHESLFLRHRRPGAEDLLRTSTIELHEFILGLSVFYFDSRQHFLLPDVKSRLQILHDQLHFMNKQLRVSGIKWAVVVWCWDSLDLRACLCQDEFRSHITTSLTLLLH